MSLSLKSTFRKLFRAGDEDAFNETLDRVEIEEKEKIEDEAASEEDRFDILDKRIAEIERIVTELIHKNDVEESEGEAADEAAKEEIEDESPEPAPEAEPEKEPEPETIPDEEAEKILADAESVCGGMKKPVGDSADGHFTREQIERIARKALADGSVTSFGDPAELSGQSLTIALRAAAEMARSSRNPKAVEVTDGKPVRQTAAVLNSKYWETH